MYRPKAVKNFFSKKKLNYTILDIFEMDDSRQIFSELFFVKSKFFLCIYDHKPINQSIKKVAVKQYSGKMYVYSQASSPLQVQKLL